MSTFEQFDQPPERPLHERAAPAAMPGIEATPLTRHGFKPIPLHLVFNEGADEPETRTPNTEPKLTRAAHLLLRLGRDGVQYPQSPAIARFVHILDDWQPGNRIAAGDHFQTLTRETPPNVLLDHPNTFLEKYLENGGLIHVLSHGIEIRTPRIRTIDLRAAFEIERTIDDSSGSSDIKVTHRVMENAALHLKNMEQNPEAAEFIKQLSAEEAKVLPLLAYDQKQIAERLQVSYRKLSNIVRGLKRKAGVTSTNGLVYAAAKKDLLYIESFPTRVEKLTEAQSKVLQLGYMTDRKVADQLELSERTVQKTWDEIRMRLGVKNRYHAVVVAARLGLI